MVFRSCNKLVKQAKSRGKTPAYTVTREFFADKMVTTMTTDNNKLKVNFKASQVN